MSMNQKRKKRELLTATANSIYVLQKKRVGKFANPFLFMLTLTKKQISL